MADFPSPIRIGGLDYEVKLWERRAADNSNAYGICDRETCVILIAEGLVPQREAEVLLHEVLHAAYDCAGLNAIRADLSEERTVGTLTHQLIAIWRDNPKLVQYMEQVFRGSFSPTLVRRKGRTSK